MSSYVLDMSAMNMRGTGNVSPVMAWVDNPHGSGKIRSGEQMCDRESGLPLWEVEVVHASTTYGRASMETAVVQVPAAAEPRLVPFEPVPFAAITLRIGNTGRVSLVAPALVSARKGEAA